LDSLKLEIEQEKAEVKVWISPYPHCNE
jgi:hypothetical protein